MLFLCGNVMIGHGVGQIPGGALRVLMKVDPDARVINLETSITQNDSVACGKAVHYRVHRANIGCLIAARPDACVLADNHVPDWTIMPMRTHRMRLRQATPDGRCLGDLIGRISRPSDARVECTGDNLLQLTE